MSVPSETSSRYRIELLEKSQLRKGFACGVEALDRYFERQAMQDMRRKVATVFVALDPESEKIVGYYTLSMASISLEALPEKMLKKLPRYPFVPAVRLGRLAVRQDEQGKGLGAFLLMDAMHRIIGNEIAWMSLIVDAKDERATSFYLKYGFIPFADNPKHLFLARETIERAFR